MATTGQTPGPGAYNPYGFKKPEHVRGLYLTAWSAGSSRKMSKMLALMKGTVLNALAIDVRDAGQVYWKTGIALADKSKATEVAVPKPKEFFTMLAKNDIYPIARIACFRDNYVPKLDPSMGVQGPGGKVWRDRGGYSWLDPYNKANWEYIKSTVDFALDAGFPEIQLDYVRFPSEGKKSGQVYPGKDKYPDKGAKEEDVIAAFAQYIADDVHKRGGTISADIFGIISSTKGDEGIGQELEKVAKPFDFLSPMCYPSHYHLGEYDVKYPNDDPYAIVYKSLVDYKKRLGAQTVRPWLQDFNLRVAGEPDQRYGAAEVRAQIKAAHDAGYDSWLFWNAANKYTEGAFPPANADLSKVSKSTLPKTATGAAPKTAVAPSGAQSGLPGSPKSKKPLGKPTLSGAH